MVCRPPVAEGQAGPFPRVPRRWAQTPHSYAGERWTTDDRVCQTASETPFSQALISRVRHAGLGIESDRGGRPSEDRLQGSRTHKDPRSSRLGATPPPRVAIYFSNFG